MKFYPELYQTTFSIPLQDGEGNVGIPSAISAIVRDEDGVQIADLGSVTVPVSGETVLVSIPGAQNSLAAYENRVGRTLVVTLTYPSGNIAKVVNFGIEREVRLQVMDNSFMSYVTAEVLSVDFVNSTSWDLASENDRKTALIEAFGRLTQIPMKWSPRDDEGKIIEGCENVIERDTWSEMDFDAFASWPTHFKKALRKAQFTEANELLQGDVFARKRRQGVKSETIGESTIDLSENVVDYGISSDTLSALTGYIYFNMTIARA